jgi:hypothetical protein
MDPALLPDGSLLFVSPVQKVVGTCASCEPSLYVQYRGAPIQQLTFGNMGVFSPTVLGDGRILFVGATPGPFPMGPLSRRCTPSTQMAPRSHPSPDSTKN